MMIESFGPGDTYSLGQRLGREAKKGDIFCLYPLRQKVFEIQSAHRAVGFKVFGMQNAK